MLGYSAVSELPLSGGQLTGGSISVSLDGISLLFSGTGGQRPIAPVIAAGGASARKVKQKMVWAMVGDRMVYGTPEQIAAELEAYRPEPEVQPIPKPKPTPKKVKKLGEVQRVVQPVAAPVIDLIGRPAIESLRAQQEVAALMRRMRQAEREEEEMILQLAAEQDALTATVVVNLLGG